MAGIDSYHTQRTHQQNVQGAFGNTIDNVINRNPVEAATGLADFFYSKRASPKSSAAKGDSFFQF